MGSNPHPGSLKDFLITASTGYSSAHAPDIPPDRSLRCVHTGHSGRETWSVARASDRGALRRSGD